jgi:hypothetical protein
MPELEPADKRNLDAAEGMAWQTIGVNHMILME